MNMIECLHTESKCYKAAEYCSPVGIVVHSTGANNPNMKRYVQPSKSDPNYTKLIKKIGKNNNGNHWNRSVNKAVHYFIGKLADGSVGTAHVLPEDRCAWGVGKGKKGSYNYNPFAHIQFEVCEDGLTNATYFNAVYNEAVALCADICKRWGWKSSVIVSHNEAYKKGYASNHADIDHWLKKHKKTMNDFRRDVDKLLNPPKHVKAIAVGDVVEFTGTTHYYGAGSLTGKKCKPGKAKVLQIYKLGKSRHPYQIKAVSGGGSTVYGWVNEKDIKNT